MSEEEILIRRIFEHYAYVTGIAIDGALLSNLIKDYLNQNKDE